MYNMLHSILIFIRDEWARIVSAAILGSVVGLAIWQIFILYTGSEKLSEFNHTLLSYSEEVAFDSINLMDKASKITSPPCSDAYIKELRLILSGAEHVFDAGYQEHERLRCTVQWGIFHESIKMPPAPYNTDDGHALWKDIAGPIDSRIIVDVAEHNHVVIFTSGSIFRKFVTQSDHTASMVLNANGTHVFRSLGNVTDLLQVFQGEITPHLTDGRLVKSECSTKLDMCAISSRSNIGIFSQAPSVQLIVVAFSAIISSILSISFEIQKRAYTSPKIQLKKAMREDRVHVVFQPLIRLHDRALAGAEVLSRITDDMGDIVSPNVFIPIAENTGLIGDLTRIIVRKSLQEMHNIMKMRPNFYLSLNLSASDVADASMLSYINSETSRLGIDKDQIVLEITERTSLDSDELRKSVDAFRRHGYRFFLDDFGTGYSNLSHLAYMDISGDRKSVV